MFALVDQLRNSTQLRWNNLHRFRNKYRIHMEVGNYILKTAETIDELIESFQLRHEVFNQEFRGWESAGLDFDKFDFHFDHLIIVHREQNRIIGTYRLRCSDHFNKSYTALEFELQSLAQEQGPYLELGRACIHRDFRKGTVVSLLWRGIAEYMKISGTALLFGCSSVKVNTPREAALIHQFVMEQDQVSQVWKCRPTKKFVMSDFDLWNRYFQKGLSEKQRLEAEQLIPSLLKSYLKQGAKVAAEPAFDLDFDCIDFLTVLKRESLSFALAERFQVVR